MISHTADMSKPRILVVGGHCRNIGKTALVVDLIRAFPETAWTAVKLTQFGNEICAEDGKECECAPLEHGFAIDEEFDRGNRTDTSRFLMAGAARSLWLRARQGHVAEALPALREQLLNAEYVILESNSILQFLRPQLYLQVVDPRNLDFKESARFFLDRADALVFRALLDNLDCFERAAGVPRRLLRARPHFLQVLGDALPRPLIEFVRSRFFSPASTA